MKVSSFFIIFFMTSLIIGTSSFSPDATTFKDDVCPPGYNGMKPNPEDCHSFYSCSNGFPSLIECPSDTCFLWDGQDGGKCEECWLVPGCGDATSPLSTTTTIKSPVTSTTTERSTTTITVKTTTPAPITSTMSPTTTSRKTTTTPMPTTTVPRTTTQQITTTTGSGEDLPCPSDPFIYMPYPGDCNKFYLCVDGVNQGVHNCQQGLWFHFQRQICIHPWSSSCT